MINILIVDDNDSNVYVLEMLVEEWLEENDFSDFTMDTANDGQEAYNMVKTKHYDIVFLDIMMPVMNGFEALEKIRQENLEQQPKIIVASAIIDDDANKSKARDLKANAFIVKPLSYETIDVMMSKYIKNKVSSSSDSAAKKYTYFDENEKVLSAQALLADYPDNIVSNDDIEDLTHLISDFNSGISAMKDFEDLKNDFKEILDKMRILLLSITEFSKLVKLINDLKATTNNISDNSKHALDNMKNIVDILLIWFEEVFVEKDLEEVLKIEEFLSNELEELNNKI